MRQVILDGNNLLFAAAATTGHLTNGTVFGFLNIVRASMKRFNGTDIQEYMIAWDKPSWRKEVFPEYKMNRVNEEDLAKKQFLENMGKQKKILQQFFFPHMPIQQLTAEHYEADDIAAFYSKICRPIPDSAADLISLTGENPNPENKELYLVSNDKDWLQLVHENCTVYRPKRDVLITPSNFEEITGLPTPQHFTKYLCLTGDPVDNIAGVYGVGEVTVKKFVLNQLSKGKKFDDIMEFMNNGSFDVNMNLINLDFEEHAIHEFELEIAPHKYDFNEFIKSCQFWKMASFIVKQQEWKDLMDSWSYKS